MPVDLQETRLPGIGTKFTLRLDDGGRLAVILHNDGKRELYYFRHARDEEPRAVITLDGDQPRPQVVADLGAAPDERVDLRKLAPPLGQEPEPDVPRVVREALADVGELTHVVTEDVAGRRLEQRLLRGRQPFGGRDRGAWI